MANRRTMKILTTVAVVAWASFTAPADAYAANTGSGPLKPPAEHSGEFQKRTSASINSVTEPTCSQPSNGSQVCFKPGTGTPTSKGSFTDLAINPYPSICASSAANGGAIFADSRLQVCRVLQGSYIYTTQTVNGTTTETGRLYIDLWDWTYSSYSLPN